MPRKIRDYKADLLSIGFSPRRGKGSHQNWKHPDLPLIITVSLRDGEDVPRYLEKLLDNARMALGTNQESDE